jgi:phosphatidylserine/phosphatidylglycerophosphate/cardiolipin synthase-like enzyme
MFFMHVSEVASGNGVLQEESMKQLLARFSLVGFCFCPLTALADVNGAQVVAAEFDFTLYTADIFPWLDGRSEGTVPDTHAAMAGGLETLLSAATSEIKLATYGVQSQTWLLNTLKAKKKAGVAITAVVDQEKGEWGDWLPENFSYPDTPKLRTAIGVNNVIPDLGANDRPRTGSIMHNKFVIADDRKVWLGSANLSSTCVGAEYNANMALVVRSPQLAAIYAAEFSQMYDEHLFSRAKVATLRKSLHYRDGTEVSVFFAPQDDPLTNAVLPFIAAARHTLDIGMFFYTDPRITAALQAAISRGVKVRMIYDAIAASSPASQHRFLRSIGGSVAVENWGGKMHMKAAVIDGKHVITGSMNWTAAGSSSNDENVILIRNSQKLATQLTAYFENLWATLDDTAEHRDPRAEGVESINSCFDGMDNDYDGLIDGDDPACR